MMATTLSGSQFWRAIYATKLLSSVSETYITYISVTHCSNFFKKGSKVIRSFCRRAMDVIPVVSLSLVGFVCPRREMHHSVLIFVQLLISV